MNIREKKEKEEILFLSEYASMAMYSKGRDEEIIPCEIRTCYERDRDRIIHSKSFRRLKHKTQVFLSPEGDHYRTRLTHTLEVSQVARTIAKAINVNENLTEAIALGHDLGHTPFGHTGEAVLNDICSFEFEHNIQSLRVVEKLENHGNGLNLTFEVRDGIKNHCSGYNPSTIEGEIVYFSDKIAYVNHDIDDAIRGGILSEKDLPKKCINILGNNSSERINTLIVSIVKNSINKANIQMDKEVGNALMELRAFLFEKVYINSRAKEEEGKAKEMIKLIFEYFKKNPDQMPKEFYDNIERDGVERSVCDYVAGMTDQYAIKIFKEKFVPYSWN